jgi:hypothetical protein
MLGLVSLYVRLGLVWFILLWIRLVKVGLFWDGLHFFVLGRVLFR